MSIYDRDWYREESKEPVAGKRKRRDNRFLYGLLLGLAIGFLGGLLVCL